MHKHTTTRFARSDWKIPNLRRRKILTAALIAPLFAMVSAVLVAPTANAADALVNGSFSSSGGGWTGALFTGKDNTACASGQPNIGTWTANQLSFSGAASQFNVSQQIVISVPATVSFTWSSANRGDALNPFARVTIADSNQTISTAYFKSTTSFVESTTAQITTTTTNETVTVTISGKDGNGWAGCYGTQFKDSRLNVVATLTSRTLTIDSDSYTSSYTMVATPPTLTATPSAGTGAKTFTSSTTGVCTVNSSTGVVAFVGAGTCSITSSIAADATYAAATSAAITMTISRATQSALSFTLSLSSSTYTGSAYTEALTLTPSGGSGSGAVTYAITSGGTATTCALSGSSATETITATTSGTCLITATKAADVNYSAISSIAITFTFNTAAISALSISLAGGVTTASKGQAIVISVVIDQAGKVSFFVDGKRIAKCFKLSASVSTKTCSWKPTVQRVVTLSAQLVPTNSAYSNAAGSMKVQVTKRTSTR